MGHCPQEQNPELRPESLGHQLVADDPFWVRLVSDPRLLEIAAQYIGEVQHPDGSHPSSLLGLHCRCGMQRDLSGLTRCRRTSHCSPLTTSLSRQETGRRF
jgi:hypothetical protein